VAFVGCLFLHVTDGISCKLVGLLLHISMNNPSGTCIGDVQGFTRDSFASPCTRI
jgi:hypothetical protein